MSDRITIGTPEIDIRLKRSARAKRYSLRVASSDGAISLTMPRFGSKSKALAFAREHESWLRQAAEKHPPRRRLAFGHEIEFRGVSHKICPGAGKSVIARDGQLELPQKVSVPGPHLRRFLQFSAREVIAPAADIYANQLGKTVGQISLRDTSSRWGSCSDNGRLMFSWRLIMAPPRGIGLRRRA